MKKYLPILLMAAIAAISRMGRYFFMAVNPFRNVTS